MISTITDQNVSFVVKCIKTHINLIEESHIHACLVYFDLNILVRSEYLILLLKDVQNPSTLIEEHLI